MKNIVKCLWTAVILAFVECFASVFCEGMLYIVQCKLFGVSHFGDESPGDSIVRYNVLIVCARFSMGFVLATAGVLFALQYLTRRIRWCVLGVVNCAVICILGAIYNSSFGILKLIFEFNPVLYQNFFAIPFVIAFFSPWLVSKWRIWTVLPMLAK